MNALLDKLGLKDVNSGACAGPSAWTAAEGPMLVSRNPATGEPIAAVTTAKDADYEQVIGKAVEAFLRWRLVPAPRRGLLMRDLAAAVRALHEPLSEMITLEMGKILAESAGEVQELIDIADFAVGLSRQLGGPTLPSERPGHRLYEQWHPLGPAGVITAFNFPVAVYSWNAAIAAVCGDTTVWKPSSATPLTSLALQNILNVVCADHKCAGVFTLLIGPGASIGERMAGDARLPLVSFTGSVRMGKRVAAAVARRLGRSILELGGNNGIVVSEDADLDLAVRAILFAAVGTAGQRCTTTRRLIVHETVAAELVRRLVKAYAQVTIGNPADRATLMGPLINEAAVLEMMQALATARAQGGEVLYGGERLPEMGPLFVQPAIVRMPSQTPLVCEETFAPILYLMEYRSLEEAIGIHNAVPQGLSSAIFATRLAASERFLSAAGSDCGIANVNIGTSGAEIGGAFGGEKQTGGGRESGSDAWKSYMRRQTVTINWSGELPLAQGIAFGEGSHAG
jgi:aldehyde dehydrogenase (NAD+)